MSNPKGGGNFVPGHKLSVGHGRPAGVYSVAKVAREASGGDGSKLIQVLLDIALNEKGKARDRITASVEILNRGFGKPLDPDVLAKGEQPKGLAKVADFSTLDKEDLSTLWRLMRKANGESEPRTVESIVIATQGAEGVSEGVSEVVAEGDVVPEASESD